jgi:nucleoid-associated protein YgaU
VEKVAAQAGKAAPAMAIAGALVAIPQAQHALASHAKPATTAAASHQAGSATRATLDSVTAQSDNARHTASKAHTVSKAATGNTTYTVQSGDSLSKIANRFYHKAGDWQWLYHENDTKISDPDLIYAGQQISVPADPPANYTLPDYQPKHAAPAPAPAPTSSSDADSSSTVVTQSANEGSSTTTAAASSSGGSGGSGSTSLGGTLSCSGLEQLWEDAGGNSADAFMAAEIAMAESGGNQYALSPTDDYGYWQINASNGALATYNAYGNARAAISLSDNGANWDAWTTYTSGAYQGRC